MADTTSMEAKLCRGLEPRRYDRCNPVARIVIRRAH